MADAKTIKLKRVWRLGDQLKKGGFGRIYACESDDGQQAVIKLIPKEPGADRELLFESLNGVPNIIPVLDSGEWRTFWVLVMPRADESLREHLTRSGGTIPPNDAVDVLIDVTAALQGLETEVVHRDLKPENVLFYNGHWCLADFGIARYASASTSTDTWKHSMTPAYAAPEQWRGEWATHATDIYALGIIAYELIAGNRPFPGPAEHDLREQHLNASPPAVPNCPPALAGLIVECLYKAPEARPTAQNIHLRLQSILQPASPALQRLQQAQQVAVEAQAVHEARVSAAQSDDERRATLFEAAKQGFDQLMADLASQIANAAPAAGKTWPFTLNGAHLTIAELKRAGRDALRYKERYGARFDVVAHSGVRLDIPRDRWGYEGRSHSLWFCDAQEEGVFRWYETAFRFAGWSGKSGRVEPFAMEPDEEAAQAFTPIIGLDFALAWPFTAVDQGDEIDFIERWIGWFADAAQGQLHRPSNMPERDPKGSWRET